MTVVLIFARDFQINNDVCGGTLSRWTIHRFAFCDSGLLFFIDFASALKLPNKPPY